jgi:hypothetical protein
MYSRRVTQPKDPPFASPSFSTVNSSPQNS